VSTSNESGLPFTPDTKLIRLFLNWLKGFEEQHAKNWELLYNNNPEAAMSEATFWGILQDCGVNVAPNADLLTSQKAPDFRCNKNGFEFFFEATCIGIETATEQTNLPHPPEPGFRLYSLLNRSIWNACGKKTPQCSSVDAPCVVGIGTFHSAASVSCVSKEAIEWLLTGEGSIAWDIDTERGCAVGDPCQVTELQSAAFFKQLKDDGELHKTRCPISAVLVGGFTSSATVLGILNPEPIHPFERAVLDRIEFCRLLPGYESGEMQTEWI
jgi:hypothetical protein